MKTRKIIIYIFTFIVIGTIASRIIYVKRTYPSVKIHNYNIGETAANDEYEICVDSVKTYEKPDWEDYIKKNNIPLEKDTYKSNDKNTSSKMMYDADKDYKVIETELHIKNISGETKNVVMGQVCSVNGIMKKIMMNYYYTRRLQPDGMIDSIVRKIDDGQTQHWKCYYIVDSFDEKLFFEFIKVGQINRISLNLHKS